MYVCTTVVDWTREHHAAASVGVLYVYLGVFCRPLFELRVIILESVSGEVLMPLSSFPICVLFKRNEFMSGSVKLSMHWFQIRSNCGLIKTYSLNYMGNVSISNPSNALSRPLVIHTQGTLCLCMRHTFN